MDGEKGKNIGFVSTRFAGTDGVSLEAAKWAHILEDEGYNCFYMAGELDTPEHKSFLVEEAHFEHPAIQEITAECFGRRIRKPYVTKQIHMMQAKLKDSLQEFIEKFKIDLLLVENALSIPVNIPLGLAITQVIIETGIPTIAHHHDFFWERERFLVNCIWDYLVMSFPPHVPSIQHVVINSLQDEQLSFRTGISATIIPNVMDFDTLPCFDEYSSDIRSALGFEEDEFLILQPTRVVRRKRIENSIELVHRLNQAGVKAKLVISHASGDEGHDYQDWLHEYSSLMRVDTIFVSDIIKPCRGTTKDGRKIYATQDIYEHADLVTYPSSVEGFGNAFLEAIYFRKPILVNNYAVYASDIKPRGFKVIELPDYVDRKAVESTRKVLENPQLAHEMTEHNYELGKRYFSYHVLRERLRVRLSNCFGV